VKSFVIAIILFGACARGSIVTDVRAALGRGDFPSAEAVLERYKAQNGVTPEMLEAYSWLGRGALQTRRYDQAESYAAKTMKLVNEQLGKRKLDAETHLPIALGAAIEVEAQVMAARGERDQAILYLNKELQTYRNTSIRDRIQKNINLLSLEGKPAPALQMTQWLGPKPPVPASIKGKPVLLFMWAHWCGDCKAEVPIVARVRQEYAAKGLVVIGPTQHYGYAEKGRDVGREEELRYIEQIRQRFYAPLIDMPVPVSEENFRVYGVSTSPTLVLIDRRGVVNMYHPGAMTYEELSARVGKVITAPPANRPRAESLSRDPGTQVKGWRTFAKLQSTP
jgi:thiol-disulfide isomerase/thioredoxin